MPSANVVTAQLKLLNQVYQRGIDEAALAAIALAWAHDLQGLDDAVFNKAVGLHRQQSRFWPTPADILHAAASLPAPRSLVTQAAPQPKTAEEIHKNAVNAAMLRLSLQGREEARAFFAAQSWEEKEALARWLLGKAYPEPEDLEVISKPPDEMGESACAGRKTAFDADYQSRPR